MTSGSYDAEDTLRHRVIRYKAARLAHLHYLMEAQKDAELAAHTSETCQTCAVLRQETGQQPECRP